MAGPRWSEETIAKGSGRSVSGVDLVQVFQRCSDLLEHWGGHPMAAGVSIPVDAVPEFRKRFLEVLQELYPQGLPDPTLELSAWLELSDFNTQFLEELDRLQPFGQGNPQPLFGVRRVKFEEAPQQFAKGGGNYRLRLPAPAGEGRGMNGVAWQMDSMPEVGETVDLALRISWNYWRQSKNPQVTLMDWKRSTE